MNTERNILYSKKYEEFEKAVWIVTTPISLILMVPTALLIIYAIDFNLTCPPDYILQKTCIKIYNGTITEISVNVTETYNITMIACGSVIGFFGFILFITPCVFLPCLVTSGCIKL
jgi:hypothetical protein